MFEGMFETCLKSVIVSCSERCNDLRLRIPSKWSIERLPRCTQPRRLSGIGLKVSNLTDSLSSDVAHSQSGIPWKHSFNCHIPGFNIATAVGSRGKGFGVSSQRQLG